MLASELRYLGSNLALFALIGIPMVASFAIGKTAHWRFADAMLLFFGLECALGLATFAVWYRYPKLFKSRTPARYAPLFLPLAVLGVEAYLIVRLMPPFQIEAWKGASGGSFLSLCASAGYFAFLTLKEWRSRYLHAYPAPVPAFTQERLERLTSAFEMPYGDARRRVMRPLVTRGFIRLGLWIGVVVMIFFLVPVTGITLAVVGSVSLMTGLFLLGRKFFDL